MPEDQNSDQGSPVVAGVVLAPQLDALMQRVNMLELASAENQRMIQHLQGDSGTLENLSFFSAWKRTDGNLPGTTPPAASFVGQAQLWLAGGNITFTRVGHTPYMEISGAAGPCYTYVVNSAGGGTHKTLFGASGALTAAMGLANGSFISIWMCNDEAVSATFNTPASSNVTISIESAYDQSAITLPNAAPLFTLGNSASFQTTLKWRNIRFVGNGANGSWALANGHSGGPFFTNEFDHCDFSGAIAYDLYDINVNGAGPAGHTWLTRCTGTLARLVNETGGITQAAIGDIRVQSSILTFTTTLLTQGSGIHTGQVTFEQGSIITNTGTNFITHFAFGSPAAIRDTTIFHTGSGDCITGWSGTLYLENVEFTTNTVNVGLINAANQSGQTLYLDDCIAINSNGSGSTGYAVNLTGTFPAVNLGPLLCTGFSSGCYNGPTPASNIYLLHSQLGKLVSPADDHTQYALLAGRGSPLGSPFGGYLSAAGAALTAYQAAVIALTPAGYWKMGEASGNLADSSGNANTMVAQGGALTYQVAGPMSGSFGVSGYNTSTANFLAADSVSLRTGDVFSVVASIKKAANGSYQCIVDSGNTGYEFRINSGNHLSIAHDGGVEMCTSTSTITDTAWHLVAITKTGATIKLYIDGTDVTGSISNQTVSSPNLGLSIGKMDGAAFDAWSGTLSQIAVWGSALSAANITTLYNAWASTAGAIPTNTNAGDFTSLRLAVGTAAPAITGTSVLNVTGDSLLSGYLRVGSLTAPTNVTAGDLTSTRYLVGNDAAISHSGTLLVNLASHVPVNGEETVQLLVTNAPSAGVGYTGQFISITDNPSADVSSGNLTASSISITNVSNVQNIGTYVLNNGVLTWFGATAKTATAFYGYRSSISINAGTVTEARMYDATFTGIGSTGTYTSAKGLHIAAPGPAIFTTLTGLSIENLGTIHVVNAIGVDIAQITNNTGIALGIRNAAQTAFTPSSTQTLVAATAILANATTVMISAAGGITLTANPMIAAGQDGQLLIVINVAAQSIVLNTNGVKYGNAGAAPTLKQNSTIAFVYSATQSAWLQVAVSL